MAIMDGQLKVKGRPKQLPIKCDANQFNETDEGDQANVRSTRRRRRRGSSSDFACTHRKQCDLINNNHHYYLTLSSLLSIISVVSILSQVFVAAQSSSAPLNAINQQQHSTNLQQVENNANNNNNNNNNNNIAQQQQQAAFSHLGAQILMPSHHHHHQSTMASNTQSNYMAGSNTNSKRPASSQVGAHFQPAFVLGAKNKAINFTHLAFDAESASVYIGAANWLLQVGAAGLRAEVALRTGPGAAGDSARDCSPADCPQLQPVRVDVSMLSLHHAQGQDLSIPKSQHPNLNLNLNLKSMQQNYSSPLAASQRSSSTTKSTTTTQTSSSTTTTSQPQTTLAQQQQTTNNNFNKLLVIEPESRQLLVCGSLNQGACRRHQLGALGNFSELIQMPVVSNEEQASNVGLVVPSSKAGLDKVGPVLYVAATQHSRSDLYREMVPSISARYFEPASRAMQIIERSFTETAKIDISFELRDYYLVNYVHSFQHADFAYFATNQRKSPLRQLEEWGHISRLARLCLGDLSFQSYTEISLECKSYNHNNGRQHAAGGKQQALEHYNLLQDGQLIQASSQLAAQLGLEPGRTHSIFAGVFSQSKEHTMRSQHKSAICLFPMDQIEATFNENIAGCLNGTSKTRDMNYIAGAVNDCPRATGKAANLANTCNEPIKLNGSIPLIAQPVITFDSDLLTSINAFSTPTTPVSPTGQSPNHRINNQQPQQLHSNSHYHRQHTILLAGTSEGELKRIALLDNNNNAATWGPIKLPRGHLLDSAQIGEPNEKPSPILADMLLLPPEQDQLQSALVATPNKLVKLRVNGCRAQLAASNATASSESISQSCMSCAALEDPLCGWCSSAGACMSRHSCLQRATPTHQPHSWQPFDQIRCTDYESLSPRSLPIQAPSGSIVEVNVPLQSAIASGDSQLAWKLAQAQFQCQYDYLAYANKSQLVSILGSGSAGAHTKSLQARLNLHTSTVSIGCPLPSPANRPSRTHAQSEHELKIKLLVKLDPNMMNLGASDAEFLEQSLGFAGPKGQDQLATNHIERQLTFYDCAELSWAGCAACTSSAHNCVWCPQSNKCTFNSSQPEFGCHAHPASYNKHSRQSHPSQQPIEKASSCPSTSASLSDKQLGLTSTTTTTTTVASASPADSRMQQHQSEILIAHQSRKAIVIPLRPSVLPQIVSAGQQIKRSGGQLKVECLFELDEDSRARVAAKLVQSAPPESPSSPAIICQEMTFAYGDEVATQRAVVKVIMNDNQIVETSEVILYKCHMFGVNPGGPMSFAVGADSLMVPDGPAGLARITTQLNNASSSYPSQSDCSLCANIERKFRCHWCQSACLSADSCPLGAAAAPNSCPPPRIDSVHPTSGPLEGGTLVTIEGSNLGSSEREIQDKITIGGLPCHLVMYSVSTRIVCITSPASARQSPLSTVFVGNRAGISSAHEMFHYKPVHLSGVSPRQGPVSGGTKLTLSGSNLNVGSRIQVFLDDIPCTLVESEVRSNQISCHTEPNLQSGPMQISRLTLVIDNSTHHFPHPFSYVPDPIITSIEPAESFISGGRLVLITGHHLSSPQSIKLVLYQGSGLNTINVTTCSSKKDTLIACLTPAIPRSHIVKSLMPATSASNHDNYATAQMAAADLLSARGGGFKLGMYFVMDEVKSVRNLEEYYHHLPHHLTYFEDPKLYRLAGGLVEYTPELVIEGENLQLAQLDQDILITIGARQTCTIKSLDANKLICEPPAKIEPQFEPETGRLLERANLQITALVGSHLSYPLGHMQYTSQQYLPASQAGQATLLHQQQSGDQFASNQVYAGIAAIATTTTNNQQKVTTIVLLLSAVSFAIGLLASVAFAFRRTRKTLHERQYKRIQLQMGSLDVNGQPINFGQTSLFANNQRAMIISADHQAGGGAMSHQILRANQIAAGQQSRASKLLERARQMRLRALDYLTGRLSARDNNGRAPNASSTSTSSSLVFNGPTPCGKSLSNVAGDSNKLYYANNSGASSLFAGDLIQANQQHQQQQQQQHHHHHHHLVLSKLTPNGKIVSNSMMAASTLQRRPPNHNATDNNNARNHNSGQANYALNQGGLTTLNFASHPMAQSYGFATSTSPLVSYSSNYNNNINMVEQQHQHNSNNNSCQQTTLINGNQDAISTADHSQAPSSSSSCHSSSSGSAASSQQCSPGSSTRTPLSNSSKQRLVQQQQQQQQQNSSQNPMHHRQQRHEPPGRTNFNAWTQEAPSTVVPYSVIEACNNSLTLEGINAIKQYV